MRDFQITTRARRWAVQLGVIATFAFGSAAIAAAQGTFSVDFQGPPIGAPDACAGGPPLTEGDILAGFFGGPAPGPTPGPCIYIPAGPGGLALPAYAPGYGPGMVGFVEVDALSYGRDAIVRPQGIRNVWHFSVDEFAVGIGATPPPNVFTEGATGAREASADVFRDAGAMIGPCSAPIVGNVAMLDGDGLLPFGGPGFGLIEPNPFGPGVPDAGTNLDALDIDTPLGGPPIYPVYFSLDDVTFDGLEGFAHSGSALTVGVTGADVLVAPGPGVGPFIFAPAPLLGLNTGPIGSPPDELDALVLAENGSGVYEPSMGPYDWLGGGTDMLFFSLSRGSGTIGMIDSLCGLPIEEGDILVPPVPGAVTPGIWVPAEVLGLATIRSGFVRADELDALDVTCQIRGDLDGDGVVGLSDLAVVLADFGCTSPPSPTCPGDADGDGDTDLSDLAVVLANFGATC